MPVFHVALWLHFIIAILKLMLYMLSRLNSILLVTDGISPMSIMSNRVISNDAVKAMLVCNYFTDEQLLDMIAYCAVCQLLIFVKYLL